MAEVLRRDEIEADFARRLARLGVKHQREILRHAGNPPNFESVPEAVWQRIEQEYEDEVAAALMLIFLASVTQHGGASAAPAEQLRRAADQWASQRADELARRYVSDTKKNIGTAMRKLRDDMLKQGRRSISPRRITREVRRQAFSPSKAANTAATETTGASSQGGEAAISATVGKSDDDTWFTRRDNRVCTLCEPLHGQPRSVWERVYPKGPPAHRRCRCWIDYAVDDPELDSSPEPPPEPQTAPHPDPAAQRNRQVGPLPETEGLIPKNASKLLPSLPIIDPPPAPKQRARYVTKGERRFRVYKAQGTEFRKSIAAAENQDVVIMADVDKLDRLWAKQGEQWYIPRGGGGAEIEGRRERFRQWREQNPDEPLEMSSINVNRYATPDQKTIAVSFNDGRHRFSVLRDAGVKVIPVTVGRSELKQARELIGVEEP